MLSIMEESEYCKGMTQESQEQEGPRVLLNSVIAILIIIQIVSVLFLWSVSTVGFRAEQLFALFLGSDVLSFAMVSYIYRHLKASETPRSLWLIVGAIMLVVLIVSSAFV
jgi:predicted membrane channel-forming protein YqfA (hemolysin III family)